MVLTWNLTKQSQKTFLLLERINFKNETNMATANLTKTFDDECCISENTTTIESLVKLETLKQYTDDPDQLPNADLLIYIMNTETDVHKVVPFTNRKLENLTDYHYFSSLTKIHNNKSPTFQSLEKHPFLTSNSIFCVNKLWPRIPMSTKTKLVP